MRKMILALVTVLGIGGSAYAAPPGLQLTPDTEHIIVQKDVGAERWSVVYSARDSSITGNVFRADQAPVFLWCELVAVDGRNLVYTCFAADACVNQHCSLNDWRLVGNVNLPKAFFGL